MPKPFVKGDPRINRKGRPKTFDAFRALAQEIAHETAVDKDKNEIISNGHKVTVAEAILRKWAASQNPQFQKAFVEIAFGKVPDNVKVDLSFEGMSDAELSAFIREQIATLGAGGSGSEKAGD